MQKVILVLYYTTHTTEAVALAIESLSPRLDENIEQIMKPSFHMLFMHACIALYYQSSYVGLSKSMKCSFNARINDMSE